MPTPTQIAYTISQVLYQFLSSVTHFFLKLIANTQIITIVAMSPIVLSFIIGIISNTYILVDVLQLL